MNTFAGCVGWGTRSHIIVRKLEGEILILFYDEEAPDQAQRYWRKIPNDAAKSLGGLLLNAASRNGK